MEETLEYLVILEEPNGLPKLERGDSSEKMTQIRELRVQHVRTRIAELTAAGALEGIAITSGLIGNAFRVHGAKDRIEELQKYLKSKNIGDLAEKVELDVQM